MPNLNPVTLYRSISSHMPELNPATLYRKVKENPYGMSKVVAKFVSYGGMGVVVGGAITGNKLIISMGIAFYLTGSAYGAGTAAAEEHYRHLHKSENNLMSGLENKAILPPGDRTSPDLETRAG